MTTVILLALAIGLLLGLLGGGGSILTVPMLVYQVGLAPKAAIASSLVVVGVTSLTAMLNHARSGRVCWKIGLAFGAAGMLGAYAGGRVAAFIPGGVLLILFAAIMWATAWAMLRGNRRHAEHSAASRCPLHLSAWPILFDGLLVGLATGLVGVGGGFMIAPALNLLGGLSMHAAVGTSLLVIALNSFAALAGYSSHVEMDPRLVGIVTLAAIVGSFIGGMLSHRVSGKALRLGFGMFVMAVAAYLLHRELQPELLLDTLELVVRHREFLWGAAAILALQSLYRLSHWIHAQGTRTHGQTPVSSTSSASDAP